MPVALEIMGLKAQSLDVSVMELSWAVRDTTEDTYDYTFQVLRSESPEGPWDPITEPFEDQYYFIDSRLPAGPKWQTLFYQIKVVHKASQDVSIFGPVARGPKPDLVANYIRRSEQTLFKRITGRTCWVFPRRTFGSRCPSCWDSKLMAKKRSGCLTCYDTGYLRGYLDPMACAIQIDPGTKSLQSNTQQQDQQNQTSARMTSYPPIKPMDLIVEGENRRWRVTGVTPSERLRAVIKQELIIREIQPTDIEFKLPINIADLQEHQPSPGQMFTNPKNLQNTGTEDYIDAFGIFNR